MNSPQYSGNLSVMENIIVDILVTMVVGAVAIIGYSLYSIIVKPIRDQLMSGLENRNLNVFVRTEAERRRDEEVRRNIQLAEACNSLRGIVNQMQNRVAVQRPQHFAQRRNRNNRQNQAIQNRRVQNNDRTIRCTCEGCRINNNQNRPEQAYPMTGRNDTPYPIRQVIRNRRVINQENDTLERPVQEIRMESMNPIEVELEPVRNSEANRLGIGVHGRDPRDQYEEIDNGTNEIRE